ncbi:relaxase/mobilization nuclease domain-containing protein [Streptomyces sp. UNOC14_S4]|uniref:relaxase/mobilization nuclease domain-containing protein n=1 Tax=Streptomyces sp. UNOC14_S4 TaxID=2872340 RepID=UPI001E627976|nr:relaxase/mobilization nuclease domain-containing protein [Streptomyces sp. UNOC14_S4]MCC3771352.1 relaxase/mobilization nuclease domain-containing protein [Streptomyces sp. UNOC14_S4]
MIPSVNTPGSRTIGLLAYLYGPGKREEHVDPHLVASFDGISPDPGRDPSATLKDLQLLLDQPVDALPEHRRPAKHVWHCSVRAAADDRVLSDEEWGDIARRIVAATGIDPGNGQPGCRWAAVRHADDHIHIVATLVCEDGSRPDDYRSGRRAQDECRLIEKELRLVIVNAGDGTAAQRPTSAERHKAERHKRERTVREELRETVRRAVTGAASEEEFFERLGAAGLLVRQRIAPSGDLLGYTVALPGDRNKDGRPVFYSGSKLAPDLSLPRIRERLAPDAAQVPHGLAPSEAGSPLGRRAGPAYARRTAATALWDALPRLDEQGDDGSAAAQLSATGELLDALAKTSAATTRHELRDAARAFERASRSRVRAQHAEARALRKAAREVVYAGPSLGRGEDGAGTAMVLSALLFVVVAAARWHNQHQHAQQAAAARQAAEHLRAAYRLTAHVPLTELRQRGRRLPRPARTRYEMTVRKALPHLADTVLTEPGWDALAATLNDAARSGADPETLLREASGQRELHSADSVSDVLVWRIRRLADLPTHSPQPTTTPVSRAAVRTARTTPHADHRRSGRTSR